MQTITKIALDAMGGDNAPAEVVKGAVDAVKARDDIKVFLVGQKDSVQAELEKYTYPSEQIELIDAPEVIEMAEPPVIAIRRKRQSSIVVGMNMVKQKEADALRQKLSFPKSPAYSDLPKPVSPESHAVESGVSQILSLEEEVKTAKKELEALKAVFDTAIKAVTDTEHHDILAKRYLEFKDWNQIAEEMGYSKPSCYRLHREALAGMKS